jgi:transcriptional regulator with XRE-family HTH domain
MSPTSSSTSVFGEYLREKRESLRGSDRAFSLRKLAERADIQPSYLSKIERGLEAPPSEATIVRLAEALDEDPQVLLALAGKVSQELQQIIRKRPALFAEILRELDQMPDHAILRVVREVRDGDW